MYIVTPHLRPSGHWGYCVHVENTVLRGTFGPIGFWFWHHVDAVVKRDELNNPLKISDGFVDCVG